MHIRTAAIRAMALACLLCLFACSAVLAKGAKAGPEPVPQAPETPPAGVYIADYANVITAEDREEIAARGRVLQQCGMFFICLTEDSLDNAPLGLYAETVRTAWGLGENDGLLLFIRHGRRLHFANGKALAEKLTREQLDAIVAPAVEDISKGRFSPGLTQIYHNLALALVAAVTPQAEPAPPEEAPPPEITEE